MTLSSQSIQTLFENFISTERNIHCFHNIIDKQKCTVPAVSILKYIWSFGKNIVYTANLQGFIKDVSQSN